MLRNLIGLYAPGSLGSFDVSSNMQMEPKHLLFTSSGRINVVIDVAQTELAQQLVQLQQNLAPVVKGIGGTSHARYLIDAMCSFPEYR